MITTFGRPMMNGLDSFGRDQADDMLERRRMETEQAQQAPQAGVQGLRLALQTAGQPSGKSQGLRRGDYGYSQ